MEKGLRQKLIKISKDGYEKRKKLREALSKDEKQFIAQNPENVAAFAEDATKGMKHIMAHENDGCIRFRVCIPYIDMWTYPVTEESGYKVFKRGKFNQANTYLRNFLLDMRDECNCSFTLSGDTYTLKIH